MTPHVDVGAYLLGALDDEEMSRFEEHLADCDECGQQLDELSGVVPVLAELRDDGVGYVEPPGDALLARLLARVAAERRARRRRRLVAVAAAAVLVIGGPAIAVVASDGGGSSGRTTAAQFDARASATNTATGVSAVVGVADKGWGSEVQLRLSGVRGPLDCHLDAVGNDGRRQTVASWSVPAAGYGLVPGSRPLTVTGGTGMHDDAIKRFEVRAQDGTLLVSVPSPTTVPSDRPRTSTPG